MARIRSIKPEFWGDRKLASLSRDARLLYVALWNQADEWGRVQGDTRWIKGHCFPYDDDLNLQAIEGLIDELAAASRVQKYQHEGDPYLFLPKLAGHQRLEPSKVPSRLPEPPDLSVKEPPAESDADSSERRADSSETNVALQVAGSRGQVAGGRVTAQAAPRADVPGLVGEFIDHCRERPPDAYIKRLGREVKTLATDGVEPDAIRGGLTIVADRGLQPTALPGAIHEHLNARPRNRVSGQDEILLRSMQRAKAAEGGVG